MAGLYPTILLLAALCLPAPAAADELWIAATVRSYHTDRTRHFNENNLGLGLEYRTDPSLAWLAGEYRNSLDRTSVYAGVVFSTPPARILAVDVRAGLILGGVTGYANRANALALPALALECGRWGVNLVYAPRAFGAEAFTGAQIKARF